MKNLTELLNNQYLKFINERFWKRDLPYEYSQLTEYIGKLNNNVQILSFSEKVYLYYNKLEVPLCKKCKKKKPKFVGFSNGYNTYCSTLCSTTCEDAKKKREEQTLLKYGVRNQFLLEKNRSLGFKDKDIKRKRDGVIFEKYGTLGPLGSKEIQEKIKKTNIAKYGEDYKESIAKKSLEVYKEKTGYSTPLKDPTVKLKLDKIIYDKYGVKNVMNNQDVKEKARRTLLNKSVLEREKIINKKKNTCLQKYGTPFVTQVDSVRQKMKESLMLKRYNTLINKINESYIHSLTFEDYINNGGSGSNKKFLFTCKKCNNQFRDFINYNGLPKCLKCFPVGISMNEGQIQDFCISNKVKKESIITNDRKILDGKELDLYLTEHKLAIEYDGLMFHSIGISKHSMFNNAELEADLKGYHLDKTERCVQQGIQLLHIFENEWLNPQKQDVWKSIIKSKLGVNDRVYARSLVIQPVSYPESCDFLDNNHLQGQDKSSIRLGLYNKEGDLLSLMTFGKSRYDKKVAWELLRFASKKGITVVGGASKLFNHFKNNYFQPGESIVSYADRRHSNGNLYIKLGFTLSHISSPNYFYFKEDNIFNLETRVQNQKHKLKDKLQVFDENLTESENMYNNGYRKVYDSGNLVYMLVKE